MIIKIIIGIIIILLILGWGFKKMLDAVNKCPLCGDHLEDYSDKIDYCPNGCKEVKQNGKSSK